ncbi:MAG: hypothetical protein ACPGTP_01585 [Bacteroidia bacterium]
MRIILTISFLIAIVSVSIAQKGYNRGRFWSYNVLVSSTTFLSDLGGKNGHGTHDHKDINFAQTGYALGGGIAYNYIKGFSFELETTAGRLRADDAETDWNRKYRMIHVRTDFLETALKFQYTVPDFVKNYKGLYLNAGGGIVLYNPKAQLNGKWYNLRPLGTEGQLVDPNKSVYDKYSPIITVGFGKKITIRNDLSLAIDISLRKTFTDYLDDVSTFYFDKDLIEAKSGTIARHFSDPANGQNGVGNPGSIRGFSDHDDNYFLVGIQLNKSIGVRRKRKNKYPPYRDGWFKEDGSTPTIYRKGRRRR